MSHYLLAIDQGTTSSRAIVFNAGGLPLATAQQEFAPTFGFHEGDKLEGTDLPDLDFLALARGQGCEAVRVSDPALLHQMLRDALASPRAILVEVDVA